MFYLEALARIQGTTTTCTQEACQWIITSYLKEVPIKDINFTTARGIKRTLDEQIKLLAVPEEHPDVRDLDTCNSNSGGKSKKVGMRSTEVELSLLFVNLSVAGTMPGIL